MLEIVRTDGLPGDEQGWSRWQGTDGSFSFGLPPGTEPREPSFEDGLWSLESRGSAVHMWIYISDGYVIGPDPASFLERIADGIADEGTETRRAWVRRHGLRGLDLGYRTDDDASLFSIRLFVVQGRFFQVSAGYPVLLEGPEIRARAGRFLDSFRIHPWDVLVGS